VFRDRELVTRIAAALLPPRLGYAYTARSAVRADAARMDWVAAAVAREAERALGDPERARAASAGFAAAIACDDLDALTAVLWPRALRLRWTRLEGAEHLPAAGPVVLVSFHVSGGFRVFDALIARGFRTTFLLAEDRPLARRYLRWLERVRHAYFRRWLEPPYIAVGRGARARIAAHLEAGGAVIGLLDVQPDVLDLRDHAPAELFGRSLRLPVGLLRLALAAGAPVVPFDARLEGGRRVLRFHPPAPGAEPAALLASVLRTFEGVIREHPEIWQGWLDLDRLFGEPPPAATTTSQAGA
jgi:lauroyl/myristoyl acyltransferase